MTPEQQPMTPERLFRCYFTGRREGERRYEFAALEVYVFAKSKDDAIEKAWTRYRFIETDLDAKGDEYWGVGGAEEIPATAWGRRSYDEFPKEEDLEMR